MRASGITETPSAMHANAEIARIHFHNCWILEKANYNPQIKNICQ